MPRLVYRLAALILAATGALWLAAASASAQSETTTPDLVPDIVLGDPNAPVTLIEYASFTCPHCAHFHQDQFQKLKANYIDTGKVRFILREIYFDRFGLWGSMLARCGDDMRYYGIAGMLFEKQKEWIGSGDPQEILDNLTRIGKAAGLTEEQIKACFADKEMATRLVATYQAHAGADDVNATPTLFIDGVKHSNMSYEELAALLDAALAEKGAN